MKGYLSRLTGLAAVVFSVFFFVGCNGESSDDHHHYSPDGNDPMHDTMEHHDDMHGSSSGDIPSPKKFTSVNDEIQERVQGLTQSYMQLKTALVNSNANQAAEQAKEVKKRGIMLHTDGLPRDQTELLSEHLQVIEGNADIIANNSSDIEKQRIAFEDMSESVYTLAKAFGPAQTLYYQYCPMAFDYDGAYWVSAEEEIRNPYFGDRMLKCGEVRDKAEK